MFEPLVVLALVLLNGFLALSELAVVSSRRSRLQALADAGSSGARLALELAEQPGRFLSAVQIGITLVGLVAGAFSGATIAEPLAVRLEALGVANHLSDFLAFGGVVAAVTYLSVIVGELVPKQLALQDPERMAARVAPAMVAFTRIAWPLVVALEQSSRFVLGLLGKPGEARTDVSNEEIKALIAEAERAGVMPPRARSMMAGVMRLGERKVSAIMTPRAEVDWLDLGQGDEALRARLKATRHSRLPACNGSVDAFTGAIRAKDVLDAFLSGAPADPRAFVREVPVILESLSALKAMELLRRSREHMVFVVDEYGAFQGLITTTNVLEAIAGTFPAHGEETPPAGTRRPDGSWLLDGDLPVDEMAEMLPVVLPGGRDYSTVAGFVLAQLMHLPRVGESFVHRNWRFEIVDLDDKRIDKVLATRLDDRRRERG
ncbi:MAG: hemolysin family protein [Nevskiaceae bacterium]